MSLKYRDGRTYDLFDLTKPKLVKIYKSLSPDKVEKSELYCQFNYYPIIDYKDFNKLITRFDNNLVLYNVYYKVSNIYFTIIRDAFCWLEDYKMLIDFDFKQIIELYESKIIYKDCCPILNYINENKIFITNIAFEKNFISIASFAYQNGIISSDFLLHGKELNINDIINGEKITYSQNGNQLVESAINIAYYRFLDHLRELVPKKQIKNQKPTAAAVALFCNIINNCNIIIKGFDESNPIFIERVCKHFKIQVNPSKARQFFKLESDQDLKKNKSLKNVITLIIPFIPSKEQKIINNYLDNIKK